MRRKSERNKSKGSPEKKTEVAKPQPTRKSSRRRAKKSASPEREPEAETIVKEETPQVEKKAKNEAAASEAEPKAAVQQPLSKIPEEEIEQVTKEVRREESSPQDSNSNESAEGNEATSKEEEEAADNNSSSVWKVARADASPGEIQKLKLCRQRTSSNSEASPLLFPADSKDSKDKDEGRKDEASLKRGGGHEDEDDSVEKASSSAPKRPTTGKTQNESSSSCPGQDQEVSDSGGEALAKATSLSDDKPNVDCTEVNRSDSSGLNVAGGLEATSDDTAKETESKEAPTSDEKNDLKQEPAKEETEAPCEDDVKEDKKESEKVVEAMDVDQQQQGVEEQVVKQKAEEDVETLERDEKNSTGESPSPDEDEKVDEAPAIEKSTEKEKGGKYREEEEEEEKDRSSDSESSDSSDDGGSKRGRKRRVKDKTKRRKGGSKRGLDRKDKEDEEEEEKGGVERGREKRGRSPVKSEREDSKKKKMKKEDEEEEKKKDEKVENSREADMDEEVVVNDKPVQKPAKVNLRRFFTKTVPETQSTNDASDAKDNGEVTDQNKENQSTEAKIPKRRRWGTVLTSDVSTLFSVSTDSLKALVPGAKPLSLKEVRLSKDDDDSESRRERERKQHPSSNASADQKSHDDENKKVDYVSDNHMGKRKILIVKDMDLPSPPSVQMTNILLIKNLVRPFTMTQIKELLSRTGTIVENGFWMDRIKSKCYVEYCNQDQAFETRQALHGISWPLSNPKKLIVEYATKQEMQQNTRESVVDELQQQPVRKTSEALAASAPLSNSDTWQQAWIQDEKSHAANKVAIVREWDLGKEDGQNQPAHLKDKEKGDRKKELERKNKRVTSPTNDAHLPPPARKFKKKEDEPPPAKLLDDLFKKTKTMPCIYWLPLTEEQIAIKKEIRRQKMMEHAHRLEEIRRMERNRERDRDRDRRPRRGSNSRK